MIIGAAVGAALGASGLFIWHLRKVGGISQGEAGLRTRNDVLNEQNQSLVEELKSARQDTADMNARREETELESARLAERLREQQRQFEEQRKILEEAKVALTDTFKAHAADALKANSQQFMTQAEEKLKPIKELLEKHSTAVGELEKKREVAYKGLEEQIKFIATSNEKLTCETGRLVSALRRPEQRGRWGEMQLRNVVELAGMTAHCDFQEQAQTDDPTTRDRPDMIVRLPGDAVIVVDSKVSLDAYLNSIQPDADRMAELQRHARQVENHVRKLASSAYWDQFERTPKLVVMFMPLESALMASLEVKPDLHADAMAQNVLIATPTLLVATLRAIAYGWQQEAIAENAREIADTGRELYDRIRIFADHFSKVGKGLDSALRAYNSGVGSLERNLLPGARKMRDMGATNDGEIDGPMPLDIEVRDITATELRSLPES